MKQNWQPMKYGVSKRELMKEYNKAIETSRRPPDWLRASNKTFLGEI